MYPDKPQPLLDPLLFTRALVSNFRPDINFNDNTNCSWIVNNKKSSIFTNSVCFQTFCHDLLIQMLIPWINFPCDVIYTEHWQKMFIGEEELAVLG